MTNPNQLTPAPEQEQKTVISKSKRTPGFVNVITPKGRSFGMGQDTLEDYGSTPEEIGAALDREEDEYEVHVAEDARRDAMYANDEDDGASYINGHRMDDSNEDPLAGDVEPTGGYYEEPQHPWDAHMDRVHRDHGN